MTVLIEAEIEAKIQRTLNTVKQATERLSRLDQQYKKLDARLASLREAGKASDGNMFTKKKETQ